MMCDTHAEGGSITRPLAAMRSLAGAFVQPTFHRLRRSGAEIRLGHRLAALKLKDGRVSGLGFVDGEEPLGPEEQVILAVPPWTAQELLPDLIVPDAFCAIVHAHFNIAPPPGAPL